MSSKMSSAPAAVKSDPVVEAREMAAADKAEHCHSGGARGCDPRDAVLDHQAVAGRGAHRSRREEKEIGARLALRDLGGRKNVGREQGLVTRDPKRETQPLGRARRGDANARPKPPTACRTPSTPFSSRAKVSRISRERASGNSLGNGAPSSASTLRTTELRRSPRKRSRVSSSVRRRPASPSLRRVTASAITSLSTSTPSQSKITTSGQRAPRVVPRISRSACRKIS